MLLMQAEDEGKSGLRNAWDACAVEYAARAPRLLAPFTRRLLDRLAPRRGERVLDVATGPGEPALAVAAAVGPEGRVTGVDLSPRMVEAARREAAARGLANVAFRVVDAEDLDVPDAAFDAVVCRFGWEGLPSPTLAAEEAFRVLRPGGRLVVMTWAGPARNRATAAVAEALGAARDDSGLAPEAGEVDSPAGLREILTGAGFRSERARVVERRIEASAREFLEGVVTSTPLGAAARGDAPAAASRRARALAALEPWRAGLNVRVPAAAVLAEGWKA